MNGGDAQFPASLEGLLHESAADPLAPVLGKDAHVEGEVVYRNFRVEEQVPAKDVVLGGKEAILFGQYRWDLKPQPQVFGGNGSVAAPNG